SMCIVSGHLFGEYINDTPAPVCRCGLGIPDLIKDSMKPVCCKPDVRSAVMLSITGDLLFFPSDLVYLLFCWRGAADTQGAFEGLCYTCLYCWIWSVGNLSEVTLPIFAAA
ncbi:hypothetical protein OS493_038898, partial [Desmophyllum pertusum]